MNRHFVDNSVPAVITERPRILLGGWPVAARNPGAIVIDHSEKRIYGIRGLDHLSPAKFRFLMILLANFGRLVTYEDIFDGMWGDQEDGGPEYAKRIMDQYMTALRRRMVGSGLEIGTIFGVGLEIGLAGRVRRPKNVIYHPDAGLPA